MSRMRLDRALANLGTASRADARRLARSGRVAVAGAVIRDPGAHVDPAEVTVDGRPLEAPGGIFVAFHKPVGYVCSHDGREGPRVWDLLPDAWLARRPRLATVGRLDRDSSGLVLVTDRGDLVHALTSPGRHVEKRYVVTLAEPLADPGPLVDQMGSGTLTLAGEATPCRPAPARPLGPDTLEVVLTEGRHRQLRRMLAACGHRVVALHRVAVGPYELGGLAEGDWRDEDPARVTAG